MWALVAEDPSLRSAAAWAAIAASYLLGAVPFGLVMARVIKGVDLREIGSGNIGATNAMRAMGRPLGLVAFALDFLKGCVPVLFLADLAGGDSPAILLRVACGAAAVFGHCFPVYLRFKGGKGVATGCGAIVALDPLVFVIGGTVWLLTLLVSQFVGLSSILMGVAFPIAAWLRHPEEPPIAIGAALLTLLIVVRHRPNIARMLAGTEPRIGARRTSPNNDSPDG